jgi:hypothetical protein
MRHFDLYRVTDTSEASAGYFNEVHEDVDLRLHAVELKASGWDEAVATFEEVGLQRLEQALTPLYEQVSGVGGSISELLQAGTFFNATSLSAETPGLGYKTFIIDEGVRANFTPAYYITAFKEDDSTVFMSGYLVSYNRNTGALILKIDRFNGTAEIASWTIAPTVEISALQDAYSARDAAVSAQSAAQTYAGQSATSQSLAASAQAASVGARDSALSAAASAFSYSSQAAAARDQALLHAESALLAKNDSTELYAEVQAIASIVQNLYLGRLSSDPITAKDGSTLQPGMLYYNLTTNTTKFYDGSAWIALNSTQFLSTSGGSLTGSLVLSGPPTEPNQASTKDFTESTALMFSIAMG